MRKTISSTVGNVGFGFVVVSRVVTTETTPYIIASSFKPVILYTAGAVMLPGCRLPKDLTTKKPGLLLLKTSEDVS